MQWDLRKSFTINYIKMILTSRQRIQSGRGVGSILKKLFTSAPVRNIARNIASNVAKSSITAGKQVLNDALRGDDIVDSLKRNIKEEGSNLIQHAIDNVNKSSDNLTPRIRKRKKPKSKKMTYKKRRVRTNPRRSDIFS